MKTVSFEISKLFLKQAFSTISPAIKSNAIVPAIEFVHVHIKDGNALFKATDLENTIRVKKFLISAPDNDVKMLIPFAQVNKLLSVLPDQPIKIIYNHSKPKSSKVDVHTVTIDAGNSGSYVFDSFDPEEFPNPKPGKMNATVFNGIKLSEAIKSCLVHVDANHINAKLQGVFIGDEKDHGIVAMSTDGHGAAYHKTGTNAGEGFKSFLLRKDTAVILSEFCEKLEEVKIYTNEKNIGVSNNDVDIICTLMDFDTFVNVRSVVDRDLPITVEFGECQELVSMLRRGEISSIVPNPVVETTINPDMAIFEIKGHDGEIVSTQTVKCDADESLKLGLNVTGLKGVLNKQSGITTFQLNDERTAFKILFEDCPELTVIYTPSFLG